MARISSSAKTAQFKLYAPQAKKVSLVGTFNKWDTKSTVAKKDSKGNWSAKISLKPGRYEYKFFVDGSWFNDPNCPMLTSNSLGSQNCVIDIK